MRAAWLVLGLVGCLKAAPVPRMEAAVPVAVGGVLASVEDAGVVAVPAALMEALSAELEARNLTPSLVPAEGYLGPYATQRSTAARVALLAEQGKAPVTLLIESTPRFSSQMNGRYRWTVEVIATLAPTGGDAVTERFTVPVALVYSHEREEAALAEVAPLVARRVGVMLDAWVQAEAGASP